MRNLAVLFMTMSYSCALWSVFFGISHRATAFRSTYSPLRTVSSTSLLAAAKGMQNVYRFQWCRWWYPVCVRVCVRATNSCLLTSSPAPTCIISICYRKKSRSSHGQKGKECLRCHHSIARYTLLAKSHGCQARTGVASLLEGHSTIPKVFATSRPGRRTAVRAA